jgi:hypothetical protein
MKLLLNSLESVAASDSISSSTHPENNEIFFKLKFCVLNGFFKYPKVPVRSPGRVSSSSATSVIVTLIEKSSIFVQDDSGIKLQVSNVSYGKG